MLQLIARQTVADPILKQRLLADPDVLLKIMETAESSQDRVSRRDLSNLFSQVLHDLRMGGAWKRTGAGRLTRTEQMLLQQLDPARHNSVTFLDLGASDGITTLELVHAFRRAGHGEVTAYATDANLWLYRFRFGPLTEYRAGNGEPIMARLGPIGLRLSRNRHELNGANLFSAWYLRLEGFRKAMRMDARIALVNPAVRSEPNIIASELNCLERNDNFVGKFTAARASNVLNLGYFEPAQILSAISHLHAYLCPSGSLVVSRNADGPAGELENGSLWVRHATRFEWVADFGTGSEIKQLVDSWQVGQRVS
jgi:hypothetical protein